MDNYTILSFDEITSTSDLLKEHFSSFSHFTIVKTNHQTQGRGQYDRRWISKPNENLLFSILLKDLDISCLDALKLWIVNGLFELLNKYEMHPNFKEPNDIYVNDSKICGILFETRTEEKKLTYVIIGIGLNINQIEFDNMNATSFKLLTQKTYDPSTIFQELITILLQSYDTYVNL